MCQFLCCVVLSVRLALLSLVLDAECVWVVPMPRCLSTTEKPMFSLVIDTPPIAAIPNPPNKNRMFTATNNFRFTAMKIRVEIS